MIFVEGRNVGFLGSLHPKRRAAEKLRVPVVVGELDLRSLGRGQPRTIKFKAVSKFPAAERDLAFAVPRGVRAQDIAQEIKRTAGGLLQSVEVFDVFEGGNLPPEHSSIAFRMVYQDQGGTLTDEKLNQVLAQIVASVDKKLSVKVR